MRIGLSSLIFVALLAAVGCNARPQPPKPAPAKPAADDHDHGAGPNGGTVLEWGPGHKYHLEFAVDHKAKESVVHVLGKDAKTPAAIKADALTTLSIKEPTFQVPLKARPQASDAAGTASRFAAAHENFGKEQEFAGTISGELDGKPYAGDFKEEAEHAAEKKK